MWSLKSSPRTLRVTKKLAEEFVSMDAAHTDRPLSERRLGVYAKMLQEGGFRPVTWAKVFCRETNQSYRVNGKHTSTLFASVDLGKCQDLYVVLEEYECETLEDVARLYATYDSKTQSRNATDINRSFAATIPELAGWNVALVNLLVAGLWFHEDPTSSKNNTTALDRAELLFDNTEVCLWVNSLIENRSRKAVHLLRAPVVGAMVGCYRKAKKDAEAFWLAVRDETGPVPTTPDRKLAKFLSTHIAGYNGKVASSVPKRFRVSPKEFYVKSIHAWNAWRTEEQTNLQYYHDKPIPAFR